MVLGFRVEHFQFLGKKFDCKFENGSKFWLFFVKICQNFVNRLICA